MDLYILDQWYQRRILVETYISLIWTERWQAPGEFELVIDAQFVPKELTVDGTLLGLSGSQRVMVAKTFERITEDDGTYKIKISGPSIEAILDQRANISLQVYQPGPSYGHYPSGPAPVLTYPLQLNINYPFQDNMTTQVHNIVTLGLSADVIPGLVVGRLNPEGSLPYFEDSLINPLEPPFVRPFEPLGASLRELCILYSMGYRIVKDGDTGILYFEFYTGDDRTSGQGERNVVIFSKSMDNIKSTNELRSIAAFCNVAYVVGAHANRIVTLNDEDAVVSGLNRYILVVDASANITGEDSDEVQEQLLTRGKQELAKAQRIHALDGEVQPEDYIYGVDYNLGDIVEQRSTTGTTGYFRVVEVVITSDGDGVLTYPTLKIDTLITPDAWFAWQFTSYWDDTTSYWQDL